MTLASGDALERAANVVRAARLEYAAAGADNAYARWLGAWETYREIAPNPCGSCLSAGAAYRVICEGVEPGTTVVCLCWDCELVRREALGLCARNASEHHPEPCSAERRCDGCVDDGICDRCRKDEAVDMDRHCPSCEADIAEHKRDWADGEQGAA